MVLLLARGVEALVRLLAHWYTKYKTWHAFGTLARLLARWHVKIRSWHAYGILERGGTCRRVARDLANSWNIILDQVFVQTIIQNALEYFGKAWEHRCWSIVTYITTVHTFINRSDPCYFKSSGKTPFQIERLNKYFTQTVQVFFNYIIISIAIAWAFISLGFHYFSKNSTSSNSFIESALVSITNSDLFTKCLNGVEALWILLAKFSLYF